MPSGQSPPLTFCVSYIKPLSSQNQQKQPDEMRTCASLGLPTPSCIYASPRACGALALPDSTLQRGTAGVRERMWRDTDKPFL